MRHVFRCPMRWADMDSFGHVNNVIFMRYLEEARIDFMFRLAREAAPTDEGGPAAFTGASVVARHEIDYRRPLTHRHEPVTIELWVTKIGAASVTFAYEVKDEGDDNCYVRASTVVVPFNLEEQRPRRLMEKEAAFLERYYDDAGGAPAASLAAGGRPKR